MSCFVTIREANAYTIEPVISTVHEGLDWQRRYEQRLVRSRNRQLTYLSCFLAFLWERLRDRRVKFHEGQVQACGSRVRGYYAQHINMSGISAMKALGDCREFGSELKLCQLNITVVVKV